MCGISVNCFDLIITILLLLHFISFHSSTSTVSLLPETQKHPLHFDSATAFHRTTLMVSTLSCSPLCVLTRILITQSTTNQMQWAFHHA